MNRIVNLIVILIPVISAAIVNFLSLPLIYRGLTKSETGIWFLLIDIAAVALALDFGISNIQIRSMAQNTSDRLVVGQIFSSGKRALGYLSTIIFFIGISSSLFYYFYISDLNLNILISLIFFIAAISINLYGYSFVGLLRTYGRFKSIAISAVFSNAIYLMIIFFFLKFESKLIILAAAYLVRNLTNFTLFSFYTKGLTIDYKYQEKLHYTKEHIVVFTNTITLYLYLAIESILLSLHYSPIIVATYVTQRKLFDFTKSGIDAYLTSIFPKMSRDAGKNIKVQTFIFGFAITIVYLILYFITPTVIKYIAGSKYVVEPSIVILIAIQFIFSGISTYIRQNNIANHLSSIALISAISEVSVKIVMSIILIPIISYMAIPLSSILGASISILLSKGLVFRGKK